MFIYHGRAFNEARALDRLSRFLRDHDAGNGTPLAAAAAAAIAIDMRTARAQPGALDDITDLALIETALELHWALNEGGDAELELPFGTKAVCKAPGSVELGHATYVLDAGRPGLHPVEITRRDAHGPNLERLRTLIGRKTRKLACRRLGLPSASSVTNNEMRHNLQFAPCAEAGGVVLQRRASETGADRFCAATPKQLAPFADSIVRDMRELWTHRKAIGERVDAVRRASEAHILAEHGTDAPVAITAIAVELWGETGGEPISLYVEMDSIDEALRPGKVLEYVPARDPLEGAWFRFCDHWSWRTRDIAELAALGATGRISDLAAGVAAAAPDGQATVLARLARDIETQVLLPTASGDVYATLYWQNGYIEAEVSLPGRLETYTRKIEVRDTLPATMLVAAIGRPLGDVVGLPFDLRTPIQDVEERNGGWLRFGVDHVHSLVNCGTGEIWPEPASGGQDVEPAP